MRRWREPQEHLRKEHPGKAERPEGKQDKEARGQSAKVWETAKTMPPTTNPVGAIMRVQAEDKCDPTESIRESLTEDSVVSDTIYTKRLERANPQRQKVIRGCLGVREGGWRTPKERGSSVSDKNVLACTTLRYTELLKCTPHR